MASDDYAALLAHHRADLSDGLFSAVRRLTWSAERLAAERERRLQDLLAWSVERSPFHRERLVGVDMSHFTEADLPSLPTMTRSDLMDNFDQVMAVPELSLEVVSAHVEKTTQDNYLLDQYRVVASSGTTGARGLFVYGWEEWTTFVLVAVRWEGRNGDNVPLQASVGSLFASDSKHVSGALHAFLKDMPGDEATSVTHLPASLPLSEIVKGLNSAQPSELRGYPSTVRLLASEAASGRLKISPQRVSTCGEQCTAETRAAVSDAWGIEVRDCWGCSEGVYAFPCQAGDAMHLPDDLVIIEPVDGQGNVVPPGHPAEKVLVTNLYNRTQPLIRYEITDAMTVVDGICECGCNHRRITDLVGRSDGFFDFGDGVTVHPLGMETVLLSDSTVAEFRVVQTTRGVHVSIATKGECNVQGLERGLVDLLARAGLWDPQVTIQDVDGLDPLWSGKALQFQPL
jgi:phenylacetate-coenzyme A ligase PaaK-like adenylate-forming protein